VLVVVVEVAEQARIEVERSLDISWFAYVHIVVVEVQAWQLDNT
jgi:hypothetical protein